MKELSDSARDLIRRVGDGDGPEPGRQARIRRSLAAAIAAGATTLGTTGAAATTAAAPIAAAAGKAVVASTAAQIGTWFAVGGVLGAAVMVPAVVSQQPAKPVPSVVQSARAPAPPPTPLRVPAPSRAPVVEVASGAAPAPSAAPAEPPAAPRAVAPAAAGDDSLGAEVQLLKDAQRELSSGRAAAALALLDAHRSRFPRGALRGERMAARVFALCELGRVDEARRDAELFLAFAPESPLVPRLKASCALRKASEPR